MRLPIYLEAKLQDQVERLAEKNGKDVGEMVNQIVCKAVDLIEEFTCEDVKGIDGGDPRKSTSGVVT